MYIHVARYYTLFNFEFQECFFCLQIMFAYSLQRRIKSDRITVSSVHPGIVSYSLLVWIHVYTCQKFFFLQVRSNIYEEASGGSKVLYAIGFALSRLREYRHHNFNSSKVAF